MVKQKTILKEVTPDEEELIAAKKNIARCFPMAVCTAAFRFNGGYA